MASIKLRGDTSGELVIEAPAVAGTNTLTLPADTANILTDNSSLPAANLTGSLPAGMGGKILQVVSTTLDTRFSQSISANTNTAITNFQVSITPSSTSSKILLTSSWMGEFGSSDAVYSTMWFFYRDSTKLGHAQTGSRSCGIQTAALSYWVNNADSTPESMYMQYIDSPSTTSAITYKVGLYGDRAHTLWTNGTVLDQNNSSYERGLSSIIAMEIAG